MADKNLKSIHASCVVLDDKKTGILLLGESGAGKSSLAYRLIMEHNAMLVADDRVVVDGIRACAPDTLAGLLELRGLGIIRLPYIPACTIGLAIELVAQAAVPRLAEPLFWHAQIPLLRLYAFDINTPALICTAHKALRKTGGFSPDSLYDLC